MTHISLKDLTRRFGMAAVLAILAGCAAGGGVRLGEGDAPDTEASATASSSLYDLLVAEVAARRGDTATAAANYLEVARATRDPQVAERAAQMSWEGNSPESVAAAELWVELAPDNLAARRQLALALLNVGRPNDAVGHYRHMLARPEDRAGQAYMMIASDLARHRDKATAMAVMDQALADIVEDPQAEFARAHLAMRQASFDVALQALDKALALQPNWKNAVLMRSRVLAMSKGKEPALDYLGGMANGPLSGDADVRMAYGRLLMDARQLDAAYAQFRAVIEADPRNAEAYYAAGVLALQMRDLAQARQYLERVLELRHRPIETNFYLGQIAEATKRPDDAIGHYLQVRHGELHFNAQVRVAALLAKRGELERAREHLHAISVNNAREDLQIYLLEGELLREAGLHDEAMEFYNRALTERPGSIDLLYARALVAEKLNDIPQAERDLRAILDQDPGNAQALNALGYTLADRTDRYTEALEYIQRAIDLEPEDAAILDSMGWVQYRLGNLPGALDYLRRALDASSDAEIAAHLGEVLWVSGQQSEALKVWESALREHPEHEILLRVMKRFGL